MSWLAALIDLVRDVRARRRRVQRKRMLELARRAAERRPYWIYPNDGGRRRAR